jgi:hypothetical protein
MPIASFFTDGKTTTHSALSRRSCGMLSGMSRISLRTSPDSLTRSASFVFSAANEPSGSARTVSSTNSFFMKPPTGTSPTILIFSGACIASRWYRCVDELYAIMASAWARSSATRHTGFPVLNPQGCLNALNATSCKAFAMTKRVLLL